MNTAVCGKRSGGMTRAAVVLALGAMAAVFCVGCGDDGGGNPSVTTYTVTFDANGGDGTAPGVQTVNAGSSITLPNESGLTRSGYTFDGWNTNNNYGTGDDYNAGSSYTPAGNVTMYAKWIVAPPSVTVTTFVDIRDGTIYNKVTIGTQTWMAENLDYDVPDDTTDMCYENNPKNCMKFGRLYDWSTAMNGADSSNADSGNVQGICPVGWHLPSDAEWTTLTDYVGGLATAGRKLKSTTDWFYYSDESAAGTDIYGFSALPGGYGVWLLDFDLNTFYRFERIGSYGRWWAAAAHSFAGNYAIIREMDYNRDDVIDSHEYKTYLLSVRCVQD